MRFAALALISLLSLAARAKETVRIAFIGPLTGGNSAIGLGGRNSADLAVKLRSALARPRRPDRSFESLPSAASLVLALAAWGGTA